MKIAFFHLGRCGSTVLAKMINDNHHNLVHLGDPFTVFKQEDEDSPTDKNAIELLKRITNVEEEHVIFDCKPFNYEAIGKGNGIEMSLDDFINGVKNEVGVDKIILIKRNNYLRRSVSSALAEASGIWHNQSKCPLYPDPIEIEKETLEWYRDYLYPEMDEWYEKIEKVVDFIITYEDDIERMPRTAYLKLCEYLGFERFTHALPRLSKTNPFPIRLIVKNFNEVKEVFKGSKYEWMICK